MLILKILFAELAIILFYVFVLRKWYNTWGATQEEAAMKMPEDKMVQNPLIDMTHAITINAPSADVFLAMTEPETNIKSPLKLSVQKIPPP